ncbi:MAG: selenium-dependent molybdenum cofactor biosynthesis protein YqeB [Anaerolineales bacterium]
MRGGGDLATGIAARLWRSGFWIVITEIEQPLAVRRLVALAEAVYAIECAVEDLRARRVTDVDAARTALAQGQIPVLVDPEAACRVELQPAALVDARMTKQPPELAMDSAPLVIGLGPGFVAGETCHAVVETNRGHRMGRVMWNGTTEPDTQLPDPVGGQAANRVLRAPDSGEFEARVALADRVRRGDLLARVGSSELVAPFDGIVRGLLHDGVVVSKGLKVGDLDPRGDPALCRLISDKALAVGGGVLEALLTRPEIRRQLAGG